MEIIQEHGDNTEINSKNGTKSTNFKIIIIVGVIAGILILLGIGINKKILKNK